MSSSPREKFLQALNLFGDGKAAAAEEICKDLLRLNPREVNTLRLYGQIQQAKGQVIEAEKAFVAVINLAKDYGHAYFDLGALKFQQGDLLNAEMYLKTSLNYEPKLIRATRLLHQVLLSLEKHDEASLLDVSLGQRDQVAALVKQAQQAFKDKDFTEFDRLSKQVLELDAANLPMLMLLADYAAGEFNAKRAVNLYRRVLEVAPENWRVWNGLSRALMMQDNTDEALISVKHSLEINPSAAETLLLEAESYIKSYRYDKGIELLSILLDNNPDFIPARTQLGLSLKTIGRQEQAITELRHCISLDKNCGEAYWALSDMKTFAFEQNDIDNMESVLAEQELRPRDQVYFGYALGKAYEHQKEYRKAFSFYQKANVVQSERLDYSADRNTEITDYIIATFTPELLQRFKSMQKGDVTPIFVVGLPRSGSTLQEQILASHSMVEGTQELPYMTRIATRIASSSNASIKGIYPEGIDGLNENDISDLAQQYLQKAEFHRQLKTPYFIDKLPNNFSYIGLIFLLFPNAKVINARRHPMDSCLGCYKQLWAVGQPFTYDLTDLGRYYRDYDRLMAHWHWLFPDKILDVQYENVVDDLSAQVHRLLDYCELPFEEACINYHQTDRVVKTSSSEQVRKPIYRSAVAYWKNFDELLDPLKDALGDLLN